MNKKIISSLLCALTLTVSSVAHAELKVAFVNMDKAMNSSSLAKKLTGAFESKFSQRAKEIKSLESSLRNTRQQAVKDSLTMSVAKREETQATILRKDRELRFKKSVLDDDAKLGNAKIVRQVEAAVLKVISDLTKQENYDLVLTSGVLYSSNKVDITDKVIAKLQ